MKDEITANFYKALIALSCTLKNKKTNEAKTLISKIEESVYTRLEIGQAYNMLFARHDYSHSLRMSEFLVCYFQKLRTTAVSIPLNKEERIYFLTILWTAIMYHDIAMSSYTEDMWHSEFATLHLEQIKRRDHVIKSAVMLLEDYYDKEKRFPKDSWDSFWVGTPLDTGSNAIKVAIRVCKSHGDIDNWLTNKSLTQLFISNKELKNINDTAYRNNLKNIKGNIVNNNDMYFRTLKNILTSSHKFNDGILPIIKSASAFLCLADLSDIGQRITIFDDNVGLDLSEKLFEMKAEARQITQIHWLADSLVSNYTLTYSERNKIRLEIKASKVENLDRDWSEAIKLFLCSQGSTSNALLYGNDDAMMLSLESWGFDGVSIEIIADERAFNKTKKLHRRFDNLDNSYETYFNEIWLEFCGDNEISENIQLSYKLMRLSRILDMTSSEIVNVPCGNDLLNGMKQNIPFDLMIAVGKTNDDNYTYNDEKIIIMDSENLSLSFLGAIKLAKTISSLKSLPDNILKVKWAEKGQHILAKETNNYDDLLSGQIENPAIYIIYSKDNDNAREINNITGLNNLSYFIIIGKVDQNYCSSNTYLRVFERFSKKRNMLLLKLSNLIFNKSENNVLQLDEINICEDNSLIEFLIESGRICNGTDILADKVYNLFVAREIECWLLLTIFSALSELTYLKNEVENELVESADLKLVRRCFFEITQLLLKQTQWFLDYSEKNKVKSFEQCYKELYICFVQNSDGNLISTLKYQATVEDVLKICNEKIARDKEFNNIKVQIEHLMLSWLHDYSHINVKAFVYKENMSVLPIYAVRKFIFNQHKKLQYRNALAIGSLQAIEYSNENKEEYLTQFTRNRCYIICMIEKMLKYSDELNSESSMIIFQALYRLHRILLELKTEDLLTEFSDKFQHESLWNLAELEALCSSCDPNLLPRIREVALWIEKKYHNDKNNIYKFAFDIIYEYGSFRQIGIRNEVIGEMLNLFDPIIIEEYKNACLQSRMIMSNTIDIKEVSELTNAWIAIRRLFLKIIDPKALPINIPKRNQIISKKIV